MVETVETSTVDETRPAVVDLTGPQAAITLEVTVDAVGASLTVRDAAGDVVATVDGPGSLLGKVARLLVEDACRA